jgi:hypothetical protein
MRLGSSDSHLSIDVNCLIYDGLFCDIYLFSISTLFKILGCATSSYVGSVLKKSCQKAAREQRVLPDHVYYSKMDLGFGSANQVVGTQLANAALQAARAQEAAISSVGCKSTWFGI